jgi:hypothetical protein
VPFKEESDYGIINEALHQGCSAKRHAHGRVRYHLADQPLPIAGHGAVAPDRHGQSIAYDSENFHPDSE